MNPLKRLLILLGVIAVAAADIAIYWNFHLYRAAVASAAVNADKVALLERGDRIFPWNEFVRFELGQALFGTAMDQIGNAKVRDEALAAALGDFEASLRLNPASARVQFQYAQALLYRSYFAPSDRTRVYEEYKKAARLTGHQAPIYFEVGKILFSQWANLGEGDRAFALGLLETVLRQPEKAKLATVLQIWDLAVRDTAVMDKILPANADACRQYAQFLGEKGLSLDERQRVLARAEGLDFEAAKREFELGDRSFQFLRFEDAFNRYQWCLGILKNIRFYQNLVGDKTIDPDEYRGLLKATYLAMAKSRLEAGRPFEDALPYLESYVDLEDEIAALGDLESYFKERGLVEDDLAAGAKDFKLFAFHTLLAFKQSRYRDVIQVGVDMQKGVLVVPEGSRRDYAEILELVGDSYQKLDYIYESDDYYAKALAIKPDDLTVLLKVRKNRERLNEEAGLRDADARIAKVLSPAEEAQGDRILEKGKPFVKALTLDGSGLTLEISVRGATPGRPPLLTVVWNDRVVWEGLVETPVVQVEVASRLGTNNLALIPVDCPAVLSQIDWKPTKKV